MNIFTIGVTSYLLFDMVKSREINTSGNIIRENIFSIMNENNAKISASKLKNSQIKNYCEIINKAKESDYIVIDLLDEIYQNVLFGSEIYTLSYNMLIPENYEIIENLNGEIKENLFDDKWKGAIDKFISLLKLIKEENSIILNEVYLAEEYYDYYEIKQFTNIDEIRKKNSKLKKMYSYFKSKFSNLQVIHVNENKSDINHKYMCKPHLLSLRYYKKLEKYLLEIYSNKYILPFSEASYSICQGMDNICTKNDKIVISLEQNEERIICCFNNEEGFYRVNKDILPKLNKGDEYVFDIQKLVEGNIKCELIIDFLDKDNNLSKSVLINDEDNIIDISFEYNKYIIYLKVGGIGKIKLDNLVISKKRNQSVYIDKEKSNEITRNINICIIGSCVSRDIFRVANEYNKGFNYNIIDYYARSSIISLMSDEIKVNNINLNSNFKRKCVQRDFDKSLMKDISYLADISDYILIDFMEERFNILMQDNKYVTCNWELREANLDKEFNWISIDRFDLEMDKLWKEKCLAFIKMLKENFKENQIILCEAIMVKNYYKNGKIIEFKNQEEIDKFNEILKEYYEFFKANYKGIHVIRNLDYNYCDWNHLWGCHPYHYNDIVYLNNFKKIDRINDEKN